jgi:WD40 repeat protein
LDSRTIPAGATGRNPPPGRGPNRFLSGWIVGGVGMSDLHARPEPAFEPPSGLSADTPASGSERSGGGAATGSSSDSRQGGAAHSRRGDSAEPGSEPLIDETTTTWPHDERRPGETPPAALLPADAIPGFELMAEIHRGGQGVVYQAVQKSTRRLAAIKVMKEGPFAGPQDRARFEREVQVLGQLNHPSIVAVRDSGSIAGNFYFVMDYIPGQPLGQWEPGATRSVDDVLRMFVKICDAVNAAHLRGVIHRDLKPSNIRIDPDGTPHILDFGLAKLQLGEASDETRQTMTMTGQFIGSLPWASPEQAEGAPDKIDLRTDVYALGVILYQMLTAKFPYAVSGAMRDVLNNILHAEPTPPRLLRRQMNDEVETIVLKCLAKERERRYQTAGELARDIRHYLSNEPIEAKRDSAWYVLRKTLRRHKFTVGVAAGFLGVVTTALIGLSLLYRQKALLVDELDARRLQAEQAEKEAVAAREQEARLRREAELQSAVAEEARNQAWNEKARADEKAEQLRHGLYFNQIRFANDAYEDDNLARMSSLLDAAPADLRGWEWQRLRWLANQRVRVLGEHGARVAAVGFHPDGKLLASASWDRTVKLWNLETGSLAGTIDAHRAPVNCLAFSPDGTLLATAGGLTTPPGALEFRSERERPYFIRIWDLATSRQVAVLRGHREVVNSLQFSVDGRRLVSAAGAPAGAMLDTGRDFSIRVWDVTTGEQKARITGFTQPVLAAVFTPDGQRVIARGRSGELALFDAASGEQVGSAGDITIDLGYVNLDPGGTRLVTGRVGLPALHIWDAGWAGKPLDLDMPARAASAPTFSPDGQLLACGTMEGSIAVWDLRTSQAPRILRRHNNPVWTVAFSPDGRQIATGSGPRLPLATPADDNKVRLWSLAAPREDFALEGFRAAAKSIAVSADGSRVAADRDDAAIAIWETPPLHPAVVVPGPARGVRMLALSPDGTQLAAAGLDQSLRLWNVADGQERWSQPGRDPATAICFSGDGTRLAVGGWMGRIRILDAATGGELGALRAAGGLISSVAFSVDAARLLVTSHDGGVRVYAVDSGKLLANLRDGARQFPIAALAPDGRSVAIAYGESPMSRLTGETPDTSIRLWRLDAAAPDLTLPGHDGAVTWVGWTPDGTRVISASNDRSLKVWDAMTGTELLELRGHADEIRAATIDPAGRRIVSVSGDGVLRIWDAGD